MSKIPLIFGLFLILTGLSSCRPKDVLSQGKMTDVLYDIHLTEVLVDNPFQPFPANGDLGEHAEPATARLTASARRSLPACPSSPAVGAPA